MTEKSATQRQNKASVVKTRLKQYIRNGFLKAALLCLIALAPALANGAPYAAFVMDARNGKVLYSRNADTRLHPASLTKMMTLYIVFEAIKNGEISLDTTVTISKNASSEPPSKLGMKTGQRIKVRYLIRAAAVKSANDAATALGEAVGGSEKAFARRMNRTAKALGMRNTTFKNANGLTQSGHLSTARDMSVLGRHLFYDYPQYYNLFSRITTHAGTKVVHNSNRRFLGAYRGADGIKTGYTRAAGFNLVSSARHGDKRIIATVFGGTSSGQRTAKIIKLLDLGFKKAPSRVRIRKPALPDYSRVPATPKPSTSTISQGTSRGAVGKIIRLVTAVKKSIRPPRRPVPAAPAAMIASTKSSIDTAVQVARMSAQTDTPLAPPPGTTSRPNTLAVATLTAVPTPRPASLQKAALIIPADNPTPQNSVTPQTSVARPILSEAKIWGINVGRFNTRRAAEKSLLKTMLKEMATLDGSLRKIITHSGKYEANFVNMSEATAQKACRRLSARNIFCITFKP